MSRVAAASACGCLAFLLACSHDQAPRPALAEGQFGIFFGSQIQQRREIPLVFDPSKQQQGFRLLFSRPSATPATVSWELDYPTARSGPRGPGNAPRAQRKETAQLPLGLDRFERQLPLSPKDHQGVYNLRVMVDGELVLERPFRLVPARDAR